MLLLKSLAAFTLLGSTLATSILPREFKSANPPLSVVEAHTAAVAAALNGPVSSAVQMTNAERMAAGLPLLPPRRRHQNRGTPTSDNVARSAPSPGAGGSTTLGYIAVKRAGTNDLLGYFKNEYNSYGENKLTDPSSTEPLASALKVILPAAQDRTSPFDLVCQSPIDTGFPLIGMLKGFGSDGCDLGGSSSNFVFFGGVQSSPAFATPEKLPNTYTKASGIDTDAESSVWAYDEGTGKLTPRWINSGGGIPDIKYGYLSPDSALIALGNKDAFEDKHGGSTVTLVDLFFMPA